MGSQTETSNDPKGGKKKSCLLFEQAAAVSCWDLKAREDVSVREITSYFVMDFPCGIFQFELRLMTLVYSSESAE